MTNKDCSLLVVDDDEMNRGLLSHRLERQGYRVSVAVNGSEALEIIRRQNFDLVLLDVDMPEMDGLEVLSTIRETHSLVDLPVIMVTARDRSGDVVAALQLGANDYVTKPLNFPVALARIQNQLTIKKARTPRPLPRATTPSPTVPSTSCYPGGKETTPAMGPIDMSIPGEKPASRRDSPSTSSGISDRPTVGDYEILSELGRGGMGVVYKARHMRMNRIVALKLIDKVHIANPRVESRFYQEIEAAAKLSHPNVVMAYDAGRVGDTHYLAMEYVDGIDLSQMVQRSGPLPISQACEFIRQAALGLQHAHERGLVHRDIKPSNLLVTWVQQAGDPPSTEGIGQPHRPSREAIVKLLDLGLARLSQPADDQQTGTDLTREGKVMGTADYMAPEQWMNAHMVDIRADLYSMGCTFYFLLTGDVPFPTELPMEKMLKHHTEDAIPVDHLRQGVPPGVQEIVQRLMAKRPEQRFQTPAELADALRDFCQPRAGG